MELTKLFLVLLFVAAAPVLMVAARTHNHHRKHPHHSIALPPVSDPPAPAPRPPPGGGSAGRHPPVPAPAPAPRPSTGGDLGVRHLPAPPPELMMNPPPPPAVSSDTGNGGVDPSNATAVFDVRTYGAVGDGVSDDTEAFKSAWDSACEGGPGVVLVPQGYSFMIRSTIFAGPCQGALVLQVEGTITPPDGPDAWPQNNSRRQWLVFYRADGLSLQGGGLIDGKGEKWWNLPCKPHKAVNGSTLPGPCDSPVALRFFMSSNLRVHGIRLQNSPQFHFRFDNCRNVTIDTISINSPALSPNTDGIHVENTQNVGIYNSVISNGDDCVSIGAGSTNIDVRNITCGPSHGISIGSLGKMNSRACVTNVTVRNAVIKHSDNGLRIKTWQGGSGAVSGVSFEDIRVDTVRNPIIIDQYYCLSSVCKNQTSAVYVSDISYRGIKGTYDIRSPPMHFGCSDSVPCTNVTLTDVELLPAKDDFIADAFCWNVYGVTQTLTIPPVSCMLEGLPRSIMDIESDRCF